MSEPKISELEKILNSVTQGMSHITSKKMFGCHAIWANGNVFALVWKHGRIAFKLPDDSHYNVLLSASGAIPWKAGPMQMAHWVLVPESFHNKVNELKKWAVKAYELCYSLEKKPKAKPKAKTAKKPAKKKPTKKKR